DDQVLLAIEGLEGEMCPEGSLGERQVQFVDEVVAVALEPVVSQDLEMDVEVTRSTAAGPHRAATGEPKRGPGADPGGHVDVVVLLDDAPTVALAVGAWIGDDLALATARAARSGGDDL